MAQPIWTTPAGTLDEIDEGVSYTKSLIATDSDADPLTYSVIAGSLPQGLSLSSAGVITGFPTEVVQRTEKQFVVRVTDGTYKVDRTFKLFVQGSDAPTWTTPAGSLGTIADGQYFSYQLLASDTDGDIKFYQIDSGNLPTGVSLNTSTGLLSGVIAPVALESFDSTQIGWDAVAFDNTQVFDQTVRLGSVDTNYEFIVSVSDGINYTPRTFSIFVKGTSAIKADTEETTADVTTITADASDVRGIVFVQAAGLLATIKHSNYNIVRIDYIDPDQALGITGTTTVRFSLLSGSLPTGMTLDPVAGELYGVVPNILKAETTFTFTVRATKTVEGYEDSYADREYSIVVQGAGYDRIVWDTTQEEIYI